MEEDRIEVEEDRIKEFRSILAKALVVYCVECISSAGIFCGMRNDFPLVPLLDL